jgi:tRNA A37 methylthiotransferase MiaB
VGDILTRTDSYRPVVISGSRLKPGEYVYLEIVDAKPGYFLGELIK